MMPVVLSPPTPQHPSPLTHPNTPPHPNTRTFTPTSHPFGPPHQAAINAAFADDGEMVLVGPDSGTGERVYDADGMAVGGGSGSRV